MLKVLLYLLKVHKVTMHTVPLYVVGGMVCAVCAHPSHFVQTRLSVTTTRTQQGAPT